MTYLEYICKTVPERERAMSGLSLKIISARMNNDKILEKKAVDKFNKIKQMSDEEYIQYKTNLKNN